MASVGTAVSSGVTCASDLYHRISLLPINEHQRKQLLDNLDTLQQMLHYIRDQESKIACSPTVLDELLAKVQQYLQTCLNIYDEISQQSGLGDNQAITRLNLELLSATSTLQNSMQITSFELHKDTRKYLQRVEGVAQNPYAGLYAQKGTATEAPGKVNKPVVECEGGLTHVQWTDESNPGGRGLLYYEVQYDESAGYSTQLPPGSTGCWFDHRVLKPGHSYSIRIRGVNGRGPGEWSESTVCQWLSSRVA